MSGPVHRAGICPPALLVSPASKDGLGVVGMALATPLLRDTTMSLPKLHFAEWNKPNSFILPSARDGVPGAPMDATRALCYATVTLPALCRGWPHFLVPLAVSARLAVPRWGSDARQSQPWAWEGVKLRDWLGGLARTSSLWVTLVFSLP